ncbi:MAG: adenylate kinase [archaeon]
MNIVLLGGPGVGKGTYASKLKTIYNIPHISTGELFREHMKNQTEIGKQIKEVMDSGNLVPDEITISMIKERLEKETKGYLLDGFPRTIPQAEALETFAKIDVVLNFNAREEVVISRLSGRRTCKKCGAIFHLRNIIPKQEGICDKCGGELYQRSDEKEEVIKERLKIYNKKTKPLTEYYKNRGLLQEVDANLDVNNPDFHVIEDCQEILDKL